MKNVYPTLGMLILLISILIVNSCEIKDSRHSDKDLLLGNWEAVSFTVDEEERLDAIFNSVDMQFDAAGSAAWLFTGLNGSQESVSGPFEIHSGNRNSILKFIDPEFSLILSDTLYLSGLSSANKEYYIKAIKK